jgi:hypothetical protein
MALAASALGLVFAVAALIITRQVVSADIDIYRATGLSPSSAFFLLLRSHSVRPLEWVAAATVATSLVDLYFGLDALVPVGLAFSFAVLLIVWLAFLTSVSFAQPGFEGRSEGKVG